jgi:spermidine synthase
MDLWYTEKHTPNAGLTLRVTQTLLTATSPYQEMTIVETPDYGRVMLLDGLVMLTERDEFVYHEMLAHPSLYAHPNPEKVLIIGGGDGGTLREVVKHSAVKKAVLVEIDKMVIAASKEFFPHVASGFNSSKAEVIVTDGIRYVQDTEERFDVILIDSTDPVGPAEGLFHIDFYRACRNILKENGILTTQSETPFIKHFADVIPRVIKDLNSLFPVSKIYLASIPTYPSGLWSFSMGSMKYNPTENFQQERYAGDALKLSYYNDQIHQGAFCLPTFVQKLIEK